MTASHRVSIAPRALLAIPIVCLAAVAAAADGPYQYFPLTPCRVVDTRVGNGGILYQGVERTFTVRGMCEVPSDAQAVVFNVTAVGPNDWGWFALYPAGGARPGVSTLNFGPADWALANGATVPLAPSGPDDLAVYLATYTAGGTAHLVLDVSGFYR
jgi:hypothetical protein